MAGDINSLNLLVSRRYFLVYFSDLSVLLFLYRLLTEEDFKTRYGVDEVHFSSEVKIFCNL